MMEILIQGVEYHPVDLVLLGVEKVMSALSASAFSYRNSFTTISFFKALSWPAFLNIKTI
jgi:hypothetical protein